MTKRVLVVEKCAVARSMMVVLLQRSGWEVIGAANGAEALRIASTWYFDLVITTPEPSKVPGLQLLRLLKGELLSPAVRVILQVEHGAAVHEAGMLALADAVLVKDEQMDQQLRRRLEQWFGNIPARRARRLSRPRVARAKVKASSAPGETLRGSGIDGEIALAL